MRILIIFPWTNDVSDNQRKSQNASRMKKGERGDGGGKEGTGNEKDFADGRRENASVLRVT